MLIRMREHGNGGIVHRLRGRPSNRKLAGTLEQKIVARVRQRYADFGPTLAAEHSAQEGLPVSRETLRKWMIQAALWIRFFANARTTHCSAPLCTQPVSYCAAEPGLTRPRKPLMNGYQTSFRPN